MFDIPNQFPDIISFCYLHTPPLIWLFKNLSYIHDYARLYKLQQLLSKWSWQKYDGFSGFQTKDADIYASQSIGMLYAPNLPCDAIKVLLLSWILWGSWSGRTDFTSTIIKSSGCGFSPQLWSKNFPPLTLNRVALPLIDLVCNFKIFLDS